MLPTGTVTFLFTDIEGSTRLVERLGERSGALFDRHDAVVRRVIEDHRGVVIRIEGDSFFAVFSSASDAFSAAVEAQRALQSETWGDNPVWVRMGLHTGEGTLGGADYHGLDVHRAARIAAVANGGQIVLSEATKVLLGGHDRPGVSIRDLGFHLLKDLPGREHLFDVDVDGIRASFPPVRTVDAVPNNLPAQLTSFIGRREHVESVLRLLSSRRFVTLTGPGGTGKTRLSLQVAAEGAGAHEGVYFVPLAAIAEADLVLPTVVATLGLRIEEDYLARLSEYLHDKRWLLVLDNFEQVLDAGSDIAALVAACPGLTALVTSRAPLRVSGEQEYAVPPLEAPSSGSDPDELLGYEAVALFVDRAVAANPGFRLDAGNAGTVCKLTEKLDGLPLALELAAARTNLLPPAAILDRLAGELGVLSGGRRDAPERQRTIRATIAWSYDLLDAPARKLFEDLAVFVGGAELEAIEAVAGGPDVLDLLGVVVQQSLVQRRQEGGRFRFSMLETIRQFAAERLAARADADDVRRRHLAQVLELAKASEPRLTGPEGAEWLGRLDRDLDNIRAALGWAIESGRGDEASELSGSLWRYWHMRGLLQEGRERAAAVLGIPGLADAARLRALEAAGGLAYWQADEAAASLHYDAAVDIARRLGDRVALAHTLYNASFGRIVGIDTEGMAVRLEESLSLYRELGDRAGVAKVMWGMGTLHMFSDDLEAAFDDFSAALAEYEILNDPFMKGWTHRNLGALLVKMDDLPAARSHVASGLRVFSEVGDVSGIVFHLRDFVELSLAEGHDRRALVLLGAVEAYLARFPVGLAVSGPNALPDIGLVVDDLGNEDVIRLKAQGAALSLEEAVVFALGGADPA